MGKNKPFIVGAFLIITLVFMVFMTIRIENKAVDVSGNVPGTESAENETDS